jgi:hypothetical protein
MSDPLPTEEDLPAALRAIAGVYDTPKARTIRKAADELERLSLRALIPFAPIKAGSTCIRCGNPWLPAPGGGIYHECHT